MLALGSASSSKGRRSAAGRRGRLLAASLGLVLLLCPGMAHARQPLSEKHSRLLNEEVVYLITDEERRAFLRLESEEARESFIQEFWDARNPARGSGRNPAKEEHYRRLDYANRNFGHASNTPGWKTDMGRTYILFGPPVSRASYTGYGQVYPLELWFYRNTTGNPSLPSFFYVLFFRPDDSPEFRYYRPVLDGPMKLVRGTQFRSNRDVYEFLKPLGGDVARAAFSLIPGSPLDPERLEPEMASEMLVARIQNYANDAWEVRRLREARQLRAQVTSFLLLPDERPLEGVTLVFADAGGELWLDYAVLVDDAAMGRTDGRGSLEVSSSYRLYTESGELAFEDSVKAAYDAYESGEFKPFVLAGRIPLVPGRYRLEVEIANRELAKAWKFERTIDAGGAALGQPLLASSAQLASQGGAGVPFQYAGVQFVPSTGGAFSRRDMLRVVLPLSVSPDSVKDYELEYILAHAQDRNLRRVFTEQASRGDFRGGRLLKAKSFALGEFAPGDYRLVIHLRERGNRQVLASVNAPFRIRDVEGERRLFIAGANLPMTAPAAAYLRALACLAKRDTASAAAYLRRAAGGGFSHPEAKRLLAALDSSLAAPAAGAR